MVSGSIVSGASPIRPRMTPRSVPWPLPVAPSEPYSSTRTLATCGISPSASRPEANISAARIGPTVCELDGPMPILKRSKTETAMG